MIYLCVDKIILPVSLPDMIFKTPVDVSQYIPHDSNLQTTNINPNLNILTWVCREYSPDDCVLKNTIIEFSLSNFKPILSFTTSKNKDAIFTSTLDDSGSFWGPTNGWQIICSDTIYLFCVKSDGIFSNISLGSGGMHSPLEIIFDVPTSSVVTGATDGYLYQVNSKSLKVQSLNIMDTMKVLVTVKYNSKRYLWVLGYGYNDNGPNISIMKVDLHML